MKNYKTFSQQYKEVKTASLVGILVGIIFIIIGSIQMLANKVDLPSMLLLGIGIGFFVYCVFWLLLYWKFSQYQKKQKPIPNQLRILAAIFLVLYLALFELEARTQKQRYYLLIKELRFYLLTWVVVCALIVLLHFYVIHNDKTFWLPISLTKITIIAIIDLAMMMVIWKYQGTKSKMLKFLTIITLNYRNYQFYKAIITLNTWQATVK